MFSDAHHDLLRPTFAEIDLAAMARNVQVLRQLLPSGVLLLAMVKADAYGHGVVPVARHLEVQPLETSGVVGFGVATIEEGMELRAAGIQRPIVVMGGMLGQGERVSSMMLRENLTPVISSAEAIELFDAEARRLGKKVPVHLKIDTGMSRLGVTPASLPRVVEKLASSQALQLQGVMTHYARAADADATEEQVVLFRSCRSQLEPLFNSTPLWHAANSAATLSGRHVRLWDEGTWWARPGLALYGSSGGVELPQGLKLQPVMSLKSQIALIKHIRPGQRVSYEGMFTAARQTRLAVVPMGYADGYPWKASGKGEALMQGRRVSLVGRVTMDMVMLDITDHLDVKVGDEVVFLGQQATPWQATRWQENELISCEEIAQWGETLPYEVMCRISKRMPRIYKNHGTSS